MKRTGKETVNNPVCSKQIGFSDDTPRIPASEAIGILNKAGHTGPAQDVSLGRYATFVCQVEGCGTLTTVGAPDNQANVPVATLSLRPKCPS